MFSGLQRCSKLKKVIITKHLTHGSNPTAKMLAVVVRYGVHWRWWLWSVLLHLHLPLVFCMAGNGQCCSTYFLCVSPYICIITACQYIDRHDDWYTASWNTGGISVMSANKAWSWCSFVSTNVSYSGRCQYICLCLVCVFVLNVMFFTKHMF